MQYWKLNDVRTEMYEVVCPSHVTNNQAKGMNPTILPLAMGK